MNDKSAALSSSENIVTYRSTGNIVDDARAIIESAQSSARRTVNVSLILRNWYLGKRIAEEELKGEDRAEYGAEVIKNLAHELKRYGKGFTKRELYWFVSFYKKFPEIVYTLSTQSFPQLTWSHYRELLRVTSDSARKWYARESAEQGWSVRTLARNIDTQYYNRMMLSAGEGSGERCEDTDNVAPFQSREYKQAEFIKDPYVLEFLDLSGDTALRESTLEGALLANLQKFLLELGKGYAFMGRQSHLRGYSGDYYIDLVFYNVILKCYVLIDLKVGRVTHQDVGQMDMYVRMYDEMVKRDDDNPTIGIVLCSETNEDVARYSILSGNEHLFASQYRLYLPTDAELRAEIESEKARYALNERDGKEG